MKNNIKKYDIWLIKLDPTQWSEQSGTRPCLVAHNNDFFAYQNTSIILPITSQSKNSGKVRIFLEDYKEYWLSLPSTILCFQIRTVDNSRFLKKLWHINDSKIQKKIREGLILSIDIDDDFE